MKSLHLKVGRQIKFLDYDNEGRSVADAARSDDAARSSHPVLWGGSTALWEPLAASRASAVWAGDGLAAMEACPDAVFDALYFDPPFFTGKIKTADRGHYPDQWASMEAYLAWFRPWIQESHRILKENGWLWIHLDWHAVHHVKVMTDEVFGSGQFRNEIIWHYTGRRTPADHRFNQKHDTLLLYARGERARLTPLFDPWSRDEYLTMKRQKLHRDDDGREWIWGHRGRGQSKAYKIYIDQHVARGRALDSVWDIPILNTSDRERTGYPTQKPEALLRRVIRASTPPEGLVGDFLAGSGTTAVAAMGLGRRFVLAERSPEAWLVIRERLEGHGAVVIPAGPDGSFA